MCLGRRGGGYRPRHPASNIDAGRLSGCASEKAALVCDAGIEPATLSSTTDALPIELNACLPSRLRTQPCDLGGMSGIEPEACVPVLVGPYKVRPSARACSIARANLVRPPGHIPHKALRLVEGVPGFEPRIACVFHRCWLPQRAELPNGVCIA